MSNRRKAVLIGLVSGALLGAAFAWVATDSDPDDDESGEIRGVAKLGPTDYFSLGMSILTLARQFGDMLR
ncbi:MAG: hypothetical protein AAF702_40980 [Chloroflexota bacterium]